MKFPVLVPTMPDASQVMPYLKRIDANKIYTNFGPLNAEFEARVASAIDADLHPSAICTVANCTVGLELALQALDLPAGSAVLVPAITFVATVTAVVRCGLTPVLADVDADSWVLTPHIAEHAALRQNIQAVMPVSTFGYAHDTRSWDEFSSKTGLPVIIDAAGAFGNQGPAQSCDIVYSFHATKSLGAGEGGAVVSPSEDRLHRIRKLSNFGIDTRDGTLSMFGANGKMSEYHCAVGLAALDAWPDVKRERQSLYRRYLSALQEAFPSLEYQRKSADGIYPLMPVLLPAGTDASSVSQALTTHGVGTRRWYSPSLHTHPALVGVQTASRLDVATSLGERILGLPFYTGLSDSDLNFIALRLSAAVGEVHANG